MKYWSIQTKDVLDIVSEKGIYLPDFNKGLYLDLIPDLKKLYSFVLESFNEVNGVDLTGVVYAFTQRIGNQICQINDYDEFSMFIDSKTEVIYSMWKALTKGDVVLLELIFADDFNPIFVDINDFQFLMPPVMLLPPYTEQSVERICNDISSGQISFSEFPSYVIQAHLPYIKRENIVNAYSIVTYD